MDSVHKTLDCVAKKSAGVNPEGSDKYKKCSTLQERPKKNPQTALVSFRQT